MLVAIAFCPSPPLLVPELAAGAAGELDPLRAGCEGAVRRLVDAGPEEIVVLGTGLRMERFPAGTGGTLAGYGVPVTAVLGAGPVPATTVGRAPAGPRLPLPLTLGAWLLGTRPASGLAVGPGTDPAAAAAGLPGGRIGLLVMGDGSARRSERAPGYVDPRAAGFDAAVAAALATGDAAALRGLDAGLGADLLAAGVTAWRVAGHAAGTARFDAELLYHAAPYGVGYLVATWTASRMAP